MLSKLLAAPLAVVLLICLTGCGDSHEAVMEESVSVMEDLHTILKDVKDKGSAEDVKSKIQALGDRMKDLKARADALGDPPKEVEAELGEKYMTKLFSLMMKITGEAQRIESNPELSGILKDAMKDLEFK